MAKLCPVLCYPWSPAMRRLESRVMIGQTGKLLEYRMQTQSLIPDNAVQSVIHG